MPNKTFYIRDEDLKVLDRALELGGESISAVITKSLKNYVEERQNKLEQVKEVEQISESVLNIFTEAVELKATSVQIQPLAKGNQVRMRVDGVLKECQPIPEKFYLKVIDEIRRLAQIDITKNSLPQQGVFSMEIAGKPFNTKVHILSSLFGPFVNMHIVELKDKNVDIDQLDPEKEHIEKLKQLATRPYGLIFVTAPGDNGKTTTIYSMLKHIDRKQRMVFTIENPVESIIQGCVQLPVQFKQGADYLSLLSFVRKGDPDIIMVGEIRDRQTAQICIELALTGHLVISVLHTRSAVTAVSRLIDMGIEPFLVRDTLTAIVGQRLARKLCMNCKEQDKTDTITKIDDKWQKEGNFYQPVGCDRCNSTGYRGRIPLFEILEPTKEFKDAIINGADIVALEKIAEKTMAPMAADGVDKAAKGYTSLMEVIRVLEISR